jgi:predicted permease
MPDWKRVVRERLASLSLKASAESDLSEELAEHLEDRYRELCGGGATKEEAYRQTISELDDLHPLREAEKAHRLPKREPVPAGEGRQGSLPEDLWRDLRYAVRAMRKSPLFVVFVVLTLAFGIGANTTVFSVINTLILNPLPVSDSSTLAAVAMTETGSGTKPGAPIPLSFADFKDYQARNGVFRALAGYTSPRVVTWNAGAASQRVFVELVTGNYFSTLGIRPAAGRFFLPEEAATPGARPVAVLNYGTWMSRFGGSTDIVGTTLRLNNLAYTIVGVAPPRFIGINAIMGPDLWIPATMAEQLLPNEMQAALSDRAKGVFLGVGRFQPGITRAGAQANLATIAADLAREYPADHAGQTATVTSIRDILFASATTGSSAVVFAGALLLVVVGIVLLIACSNVANLMLARSAARQQEMAVRLAMGASQPRLFRQLLTENMLLGMLSGGLGVLIGNAGLRLLFGTLPAAGNFVQPKMDSTVLGFALLISVATGILFGAVPAFKTSRASVAEALKQSARTTGRSRGGVRLANALLVGQVAFSFVLLTTAALFLRSIQRAYEIDPGFQTAHLAVFMTNPGQAGYGKPQTRAFYRDVRRRVASLPGVESASWASNLPLWARAVNGLQVEGLAASRPARQGRQPDTVRTILNTVDRDYFETAGVTILSGRAFTDLDLANTTPAAIVNDKMAHDLFPGGALGKRIQLPGEKVMRQIVGVAKTANYSAWGEAPQFCVYVPLEQNESEAMTLYVRSRSNPQDLFMPVEHEIRAAWPEILVTGARTGREIIDGSLYQPRIAVALLSIFGLLAITLASIGLYGILAYSVSQRKREIGLRMALGATRSTVLGVILKEGMSLVMAGVLIGFATSLAVGRLLSRLLYGVSAVDPVSIGAAVAVLSTIALLACYVPARRASRVDPLTALREA